MSTSATLGPRADRIGKPIGWAKPHDAGMPLRGKRSRTIREVGAIVSVLMLIMLGGLALTLRAVLALTQGMH